MAFSRFEQDIMAHAIAPSPLREQLGAQFSAAGVKRREYSGFGVFIHFEMPANIEPIKEPANFELSRVSIELEGLEYGAGAVLFVRKGLLDMLELFTYGEGWPEIIGKYQLSYVKQVIRIEEKDGVEIIHKQH